jgi:hypothetical protein
MGEVYFVGLLKRFLYMYNFLFLGKIRYRFKLIGLLMVLFLIVFFIGRLFFVETRIIPSDFLKAHKEANQIANDIVSLLNSNKKDLELIEKLNKDGDFPKALVVISRALQDNQEAYSKAINLSRHLEIMAGSLISIQPSSLRQVALEAISTEITLISRLLQYNDYLKQIFELLRLKFSGESKEDNNLRLLIEKANNEARIINDLNKKFNDLMVRFNS